MPTDNRKLYVDFTVSHTANAVPLTSLTANTASRFQFTITLAPLSLVVAEAAAEKRREEQQRP